MKIKNINNLDVFFLRTPTFPLHLYNKIPNDNLELETFVSNLYENYIFREAIYLASVELFEEWTRSLNNKNCDLQKNRLLHKSILKYYIRSTTNCVPFGLFASYSILNKNISERKSKQDVFCKHIDIKASVISNIIDCINQSDKLQDIIYYRINGTLFISQKICNYIDYHKTEFGKRNFVLSDLEFDSVLELIFSFCEECPRTKSMLIDLLLQNVTPITYGEAKAYINELILSKILVSSLELHVNGKPPLLQIEDFLLQNYNEGWKEDLSLTTVMNMIDSWKSILDNTNSLECNIDIYKKASNILGNIFPNYTMKNIVDVDLKRLDIPTPLKASFDDDLYHIKKAISLLSLFTIKRPEIKYNSHKNIEKFKKAFLERYEDTEVPLLEVLNKEVGIGYIQGLSEPIDSILIDDLNIIYPRSNFNNIHSDSVSDKFWIRAITRAIAEKRISIDLKNEDLSVFNEENSDFVGTLPVIYTRSNNKIYIDSAGGESALHFVGRFTCKDVEAEEYGKIISQIEAECFPDKIVAEIIHFPTYESGTIAMRNVRREYEIPILNNCSDCVKRIELNDLTISVIQNKIVIKSRKYNKEVIPFLSCAQNFHYDTIPIFHFLCDIQVQYRGNLLALDYSSFIHQNFNFIPRIEYDNKIILSLARWKFDMSECYFFLDINNKIVFENFQKFREEQKIPRYVGIIEDENEPLIIDTENELLVELIGERLRKKGTISLSECIYDFENTENNDYANQFIATFIGEKNHARLELKSRNKDIYIKRKFIPGDEWLYYKIYIGTNRADKILTTAIKTITEILEEAKIIDKWFFIRYNDPLFHIRLRFHYIKTENRDVIIEVFNKHIQQFVDDKSISKVEIVTYEREIERYFNENIEDSEELFFQDSKLIIQILYFLKFINGNTPRWVYALKNIHILLDTFGLSYSERGMLFERLYDGFSIEFNARKKVRKQIDLKFRDHFSMIEDFLSEAHEQDSMFRERQIWRFINNIKNRLSKDELYELISSHIHMSVNRLIKSYPRMHELALYGILQKYYKKIEGLKMHTSKKSDI